MNDLKSGSGDLPPDVAKTLTDASDDSVELAGAWRLAGLAADPLPSETDVAAAEARFKSAIAPERQAKARRARPKSRRRSSSRAEWALAAIAAIFILVLFARPRTETVSAPIGERVEAVLPDGSRVELAPASTLSYARGPLAERREVRLDGEAYFEIVRSGRPFEVRTFNATVTARGTAFNVRTTRAGSLPATRIVLASGIVDVAARDRRKSVRLQPGEMSEVLGGELPSAPRQASIRMETSWRRGGFAAVDQQLSSILEQVERRFGVRVSLRNGSLADDTLSVYLPTVATADTILRDVCAVVGCHVELQGQGYVLDGAEGD